MSLACSIHTTSTVWPLMSMPMMSVAYRRASSAFAASLMPPALPRPPTCTCAFTTTGYPTRSAAATASSTAVTASPADTGMPYRANSCLPWYSNRSTGLLESTTPAGSGPAVGQNGGSTGRLGLPSVERLLEPLVDGVQRGARREELGDADLLELGDVGVGDDAAAEHHDLAQAPLPQELHHAREERHVGAREQRQADGVGVLLQDGLRDLLGRLVQPGVDHLEPTVAQCPGDDLGAAIVTVEAGFRDDDSVPALHAAGTIATGPGIGR